MISRAALAVFAWVVAEFLLFGWAISALGATPVVLGSVAAAAIGSLLLRRNVPGLVTDSIRHLAATPQSPQSPRTPRAADTRSIADRAVLSVAGILLIVPGLLSGVVGALLVVPPIRAVVGPRLLAPLAQFVPFGLRRPAGGGRRFWPDVVDVDLVNEDIAKSARGLDGASELN
jgi:UPF0716 protein FxsA